LICPRRLTATSGKAAGLYRAEGSLQLDSLPRTVPMHDWMRVIVAPPDPHPSDAGHRV
jgi:hypothetical protein